jgi:hypothetical protein
MLSLLLKSSASFVRYLNNHKVLIAIVERVMIWRYL